MGKVIVIIACILIVLTITAGFIVPEISDFIGPVLVFDIILLCIGIIVIARETRPAHY